MPPRARPITWSSPEDGEEVSHDHAAGPRDAGVTPAQVDYINARYCRLPVGDAVEAGHSLIVCHAAINSANATKFPGGPHLARPGRWPEWSPASRSATSGQIIHRST